MKLHCTDSIWMLPEAASVISALCHICHIGVCDFGQDTTLLQREGTQPETHS